MGNEVELNKENFTDSNVVSYLLRDLERYDFSNNAAWKKEVWKEYGNITDIYKKTALDVALTIEFEKYREEGDYKFGKEFAKRAQEYFAEYIIEDPDSDSPLLQKIYGELWDNKYLEGCKSFGKIKGETMNSIWKTLDSLGYKSKYLFLSKYVKSRWKESVSEIDFEEDFFEEDADKSEFVSNLDKIRGLRTFLESAHTLGNFIPVPAGCNQPRGTGELQDYWDLTLKVIYDYYMNGVDEIGKIDKIVGSNKKEDYQNWLDTFKKSGEVDAEIDRQRNWDNFVRKNYMRAFVNIKEYGKEKYDENEHYGIPKELWDGHFNAFSDDPVLRKKVLPENTKQAEQFFERASFCIHERSVDMIDELKKRL